MLRLAKQEDMAELIRMGQRFFDVSGYGEFTSFNKADTSLLLSKLIESESLLTDGSSGMIGFVVFPILMNSSYLVAQELFWWVDEDKRNSKLGLELLESAEKQAKALGAKSMIMLSINSLAGEKINKLYESLGYERQETTYMRGL